MTVVWDKDRALAQPGGDQGLLREAAEIFHQECPTSLANLHRALAAHNADTLGKTAHRVKAGIGCLTGGTALSAVAKLEDAACEHDFAHASAAWNEAQHELACPRASPRDFSGRGP